MNILWIDNDEPFALTMKEFFSWYSLESIYLNDASKAVSILKEKEIKLVIAALEMEPISGISLCQALRTSQHEVYSQTSFLIFGPEEARPEQYKLIRKLGAFYICQYDEPNRWLGLMQTILDKSL